MALTTKTEAEAYLVALRAAYAAVIGGQEYTITTGGNTRRLKRNDIETIRNEIKYWESYIADIDASTRGMQIRFGTPHR